MRHAHWMLYKNLNQRQTYDRNRTEDRTPSNRSSIFSFLVVVAICNFLIDITSYILEEVMVDRMKNSLAVKVI